MRGMRWIVGLACGLLLSASASLVVHASEPDAPREGGRAAPDTARVQTWTGTSALFVKGACLDDGLTCVGGTTRQDGAFFLPAPAQAGDVLVSWTPVDDSLRVLRVRVAGMSAEGESPLLVSFSGLEAGEHAIRIEPTRRVVGAHDQVADWTATFVVNAAFGSLETRGQSGYAAGAGCVLGTCDPLTRFDGDTLVVPWRAQGELVAEWDPREGPMRVSVRGTGFVAEGETPLRLDLSGLTMGEWAIDVAPAGVAAPFEANRVGWLVRLTEAP